jgi:hypothetical protein
VVASYAFAIVVVIKLDRLRNMRIMAVVAVRDIAAMKQPVAVITCRQVAMLDVA